MMALAPSSPRLPSPPPAPEIQSTPGEQLTGDRNSRSGSHGSSSSSGVDQERLHETNSRRRIYPGTKAADMAAGPPLIPFQEIDSAFQLREHLAALHFDRTDRGRQPLSRAAAIQIARSPLPEHNHLWLYELCRFTIAECNKLIVGFLFDTPPCSASTCPEMRASEWQFLCAVHEQPKSCCAIDYCCHTLDWAASVVTDHKTFPSRMAPDGRGGAGSGQGSVGPSGNGFKSLVNIFRRLHRIFAHAWFQHRGVFWAVESATGLYLFFKVVCDMYELLPGENFKLPPEAEGLESTGVGSHSNGGDGGEGNNGNDKSIYGSRSPSGSIASRRGDHGPSLQVGPTNRNHTRRHVPNSPSTGSAVTTVMEADEDEGTGGSVVTGRQEAHKKPQEATGDDTELEVPVMVEREPTDDADGAGADDTPVVENRVKAGRGSDFEDAGYHHYADPDASAGMAEPRPTAGRGTEDSTESRDSGPGHVPDTGHAYDEAAAAVTATAEGSDEGRGLEDQEGRSSYSQAGTAPAGLSLTSTRDFALVPSESEEAPAEQKEEVATGGAEVGSDKDSTTEAGADPVVTDGQDDIAGQGQGQEQSKGEQNKDGQNKDEQNKDEQNQEQSKGDDEKEDKREKGEVGEDGDKKTRQGST